MATEASVADKQQDDPSRKSGQSRLRPIRVWPALLLIVAMIVARLLPTLVEDGPPNLWMSAAFGPMLCSLLLLLWWLAISRASWLERIVGFLGVVGAATVAGVLMDSSMHGPAIMVLTIPMGMAGFALAATACSRMLSFKRTLIAILLAACGFGFSTALRSEGMWGDFSLGLHWRWDPSAEDQMLANQDSRSTMSLGDLADDEIGADLAEPEWSEFRGPDRTGRQRGPKIASDWEATAPKQLWRIAVGPGWSSFVVAGELLFTHEQRGSMETVVCYHADSGSEIWTREVESRFEDPLGGPGPRATPTLAGGGLFVLGAEGHLMRLDPRTGDIEWQQDLREVADRQPPMWGFCSSPLVVDSVVIVHAGGEGDKGTLAFDAETGDLQWSAAAGDHSYSSPQLCTVADEPLVLMLTNVGIRLLEPRTGAVRLAYEWKHQGYRVLQPHVIDQNTILLPTGMGSGTRRIRIAAEGDELAAEEMWTSRSLKPDYNDFVVFEGHAYGFDGTVFTCINLETGSRAWKGGRYGKGQVLLLEDSGLLLVATETGEAVLLEASPSGHTELASLKALEGKTWNHPVVVGDRLYIRNSKEAACYQLPLAADAGPSA